MIAEVPRGCRRCHAQIVWAQVWYLEDVPVRRAPKLMPVDAPSGLVDNAEGNLAVHRSSAGAFRARVLKAGEDPMATEVRGMPHFATCKPAPTTPGVDPRALPDNVTVLATAGGKRRRGKGPRQTRRKP